MKRVIDWISGLGELSYFGWLFFKNLFRRPFRARLFVSQMYLLGVGSTPIILLVSIFTGAVFALQTGYAFRLFNAETMVGMTVGLSLTREIGPVFSGLMVIARAGSAMAAELGSMKVTEQIDALKTMAVDPFHYLVVPRVLASIVCLPLLTILFNVVGFLGAYLVGVGLLGIPDGPFMHRMQQHVGLDDLYGGLLKSVCFGFLIALVCCYQGFTTTGGAKGVGRSTTRAVVLSSVSLLVFDYFITQWILEFIGGGAL